MMKTSAEITQRIADLAREMEHARQEREHALVIAQSNPDGSTTTDQLTTYLALDKVVEQCTAAIVALRWTLGEVEMWRELQRGQRGADDNA